MKEGKVFMDRIQKSNDFEMETRYISPGIMNSPYGYKIVVPVFNDIVPQYYKNIVLETANIFMKEYFSVHGIALEARSIYVDGQLSVYLDKLPWNKKYRLHIVLYIKKERDLESQDYILEIPISPSDLHFGEFRQCIMNVFGRMFEGVE